MSVERPVPHLNSDLFPHPLRFPCHVLVVLLRLVNSSIQLVVNGLLIPLIYKYQDFLVELRLRSLMSRGRGGAMVTADIMSPAASFLLSGNVVTGIRLVQRRLSTACLWVTFLVVRYFRRGSGILAKSMFSSKFRLLPSCSSSSSELPQLSRRTVRLSWAIEGILLDLLL